MRSGYSRIGAACSHGSLGVHDTTGLSFEGAGGQTLGQHCCDADEPVDAGDGIILPPAIGSADCGGSTWRRLHMLVRTKEQPRFVRNNQIKSTKNVALQFRKSATPHQIKSMAYAHVDTREL
jgi:hypothetical protein